METSYMINDEVVSFSMLSNYFHEVDCYSVAGIELCTQRQPAITK